MLILLGALLCVGWYLVGSRCVLDGVRIARAHGRASVGTLSAVAVSAANPSRQPPQAAEIKR